MSMIQVQNLTKIYGATPAIEHLDFSVEKGEIVGFLGPNGAGKTTTMRILAGSLGATGGNALIGGVDVFRDPRTVKQMVGYLPETPPLYADMTVRSYLRFCARVKHAENPRRAVEDVIERVGLKTVSHRLIGHLSKGFRQRVGLGQALVHSPRVLILDEPASGLDPAQRVEIRELVRELSAGDVTVVLSTHVLPEVEAICKRVIIIDQGQIIAQDDVTNLQGGGRSIRLRVARPPEDGVEKLLGIEGVGAVARPEDDLFQVEAASDVREEVARVAVDWGLLELGSRRGLEDVYLQLTAENEVDA
jgi:ABC-2 type transport system ATP-binding protein